MCVRECVEIARVTYTLGAPGMEKSSISLFRRIPVEGEMSLDPKPVLMVVVIETAFRAASTIERWLVPLSSGK